MIEVADVVVRFGGVQVLDSIDLAFERGKITGIVGPGGSGKSTLLKAMCGLVPLDSGDVRVDGRSLARLSGLELAQLRANFGVLFQNNALYDFMNVADNVGFPLVRQGRLGPAEIAERVRERLEAVDLGHALGLFPNELSGGMKKRVSLARATIAEAPILLYDDPSAGLDPVTSSKIFRLVEELHDADKDTTVVVSHDVDRMVAVCHSFVLLYEGRVRFEGSAEAARSSGDPVVRGFFQGAAV